MQRWMNLEVGESFDIGSWTSVLRVPTGWLYILAHPSGTRSVTFIPLSLN